MRGEWTGAKRIVVKIGSSLLVDAAAGTLRQAWLEALADDIADLRKNGKEVVVVSSGAIALGRNALKLPKGALKLEDSQAAAAVGQIDLAHAYEEAFRARSLVAAQVLLTLGDTEERRRYLNARSTMTTLLKLGAVPVVNENDTVATSEIRYGDNDRLAARVASMMSADCLVLLSDVDGFYTAPPRLARRCAPARRGDRDHAGDRSDGGGCRLRAVERRHGDEDRGGEDRGLRRHAYGDREGKVMHPLRRSP